MLLRASYAQILVGALLVLAQGCANIGGPKAPEVALRILTAVQLNPDESGRPSPVVLKVFDLKERVAFENARYFELWENPESILGKDLIAVREVEISPGQALEIQLESTTPESRYVAVAAGFRRLDDARWRDTLQLPDDGRVFVNLSVDSLALELTEGRRRDKFLERAED